MISSFTWTLTLSNVNPQVLRRIEVLSVFKQFYGFRERRSRQQVINEPWNFPFLFLVPRRQEIPISLLSSQSVDDLFVVIYLGFRSIYNSHFLTITQNTKSYVSLVWKLDNVKYVHILQWASHCVIWGQHHLAPLK